MSTETSLTTEDFFDQQFLEGLKGLVPVVDPTEQLTTRLIAEVEIAVGQIESSEVQAVVQSIFEELLRLLVRLGLVNSNLKKLDTLLENLSILEVLQFEIRYLIDFIEQKALKTPGLEKALFESLDGVHYSLTHDVKRVFEREMTTDLREKSTPVVYGKIRHSHGLLSNCLEQSVITLLKALNSQVDPVELFDDFEERLRQSLLLCNDLVALRRVVRVAQAEQTSESLGEVVRSAIEFRDGTMHFLMYRDWRSYELLALALIRSIESNFDSRDLLHRFSCYLEILYSHVKLRAVLRNVFSGKDTAPANAASSETVNGDEKALTL